MESEAWKEISENLRQAITQDVADLSGDNPGLRKFIKNLNEQLIEETALKTEPSQKETDKLINKLHGSYELCKKDFKDKHNSDVNKTTAQKVKTMGGQFRRGSGAAFEMAAGAAIGLPLVAAGTATAAGGGVVIGVGSLLGAITGRSMLNEEGSPNIIEGIGVGVGGLGVAALAGGGIITAAPFAKLAASDTSVKLLAEIGFTIAEIEGKTSLTEINDMRKIVGFGNVVKHIDRDFNKTPRDKVITESIPKYLIGDDKFLQDELNNVLFKHFDNNLSISTTPLEEFNVGNLTIYSSIADKEVMKTILQYQMVRHFGKLSEDGKEFHYDTNKMTNFDNFQKDLNNAHNHIEDYNVLHEAISKMSETLTITPRMQNKIANTIMPALINNVHQSTDLAVKLADKLIEKRGGSVMGVFSRISTQKPEFTIKKDELHEIAAKTTRGDKGVLNKLCQKVRQQFSIENCCYCN